MKNLQTKLNLIESHQNIVSEEIYQSLHHSSSRDDVKMEKDSNNNATVTTTTATITNNNITTSTKVKSTTIQKPIDIKNNASAAATAKNVKLVENSNIKSSDNVVAAAVSQLPSGTNTLKRKRETKSPTKQAADSTTFFESSKKQQQDQQLPSPTVATILVSKTKTKSGLPLLLKK